MTEQVSQEPTLEQQLNISGRSHTFANFKRMAGTGTAFKAFKAFASLKGPSLLLCYGGIGNGKTYLLEATSLELYRQGIFCGVMPMVRLMRTLKRSMRDGYRERPYDEILDTWCRAGIVLLDDVGMGMMDSQWEISVLEELVNYRYQHRLRTAMVTNKTPDDLPVRVVSRFSEEGIGVIVQNQGKDFRRKR
jgi:DNA replication protein DnaC